jgi:7-cyano-7-deazaguanine synthase
MSDSRRKALVVLSGGQDSTTCLFWALAQDFDVHAVTFNYGQRHSREIESAKRIAALAGISGKHEVVDIGPILKGTSPLVSGNDLEQYADHNSLPGGLEKTFVPMRNQLFLTVAANRAYVMGCSDLVTGVCQEDFGGYPDCRQEFIDLIEGTCNAGTFCEGDQGLLRIHTPLMDLTKAVSVQLACELEGCYRALAYSHTSYDGAYPPVGKDHATLLRAKGFIEAGIPDPLVLRAWQERLMDLPQTPNYFAGDLARLDHFLKGIEFGGVV